MIELMFTIIIGYMIGCLLWQPFRIIMILDRMKLLEDEELETNEHI